MFYYPFLSNEPAKHRSTLPFYRHFFYFPSPGAVDRDSLSRLSYISFLFLCWLSREAYTQLIFLHAEVTIAMILKLDGEYTPPF